MSDTINRVNLVRYLISQGESQTNIAAALKISRRAVYRIKNGQAFKFVPNPVTLKQFPNYTIYSNGLIVSNTKGKIVDKSLSGLRETVRLVDRNSKRVRVPVSTLVQKAFTSKK
jgi:transcriptional regulator with XRE-family HTH domain